MFARSRPVSVKGYYRLLFGIISAVISHGVPVPRARQADVSVARWHYLYFTNASGA